MTNSKITEPVVGYTTGPADVYPAVLRAMSAPHSKHDDPWFQDFYLKTNEKLKKAMRTEHMPVILHSQTALGLEASAPCLLGEGDVLLNIATGPYGKGYKTYAKPYAKEIIEIEAPDDFAIDPQQVRDAFKRRPDIKVVSVVHLETPSGTVNPCYEIGRIAHEYGALTVVDAATSWAGMDCNPDSAGADLFITGPHKCLGGTMGLTLLGVSPAAWAHMEKNPRAPRGSILSILDWRNTWKPTERYPIMPSIAEIYGLSAALDLYLEEGDEAVWARHTRAARIFRAGLYAMGLRIWPKSEAIAADTAIVVKLPDGVSAGRVTDAARTMYSVNYSRSPGDLHDKVVVVSLIGRLAQPIHAVTALAAFAGAVNAAGGRVDAGVGVNAALQEIARNGA